MIKRKSTKGIKRGPYRRNRYKGFEQYVSEVFCDSFNKLNVSQSQFLEDNGDKVNRGTFSRVLNGFGGANINTIATIADMLGLEIVIQPKQTDEDENQD